VHGKNDFADVSKNLDTDLKIILLDRQIISWTLLRSWLLKSKLFVTLLSCLSVLHNYFRSTKLFLDLYLTKF